MLQFFISACIKYNDDNEVLSLIKQAIVLSTLSTIIYNSTVA